MLRQMRSGVLSGFFIVMLVLGALGLALSDMGGSFRNGVGNTDIVKAGNEKISSQEFNRAVQRSLVRMNMSPQDAYEKGLIDNILNEEIRSIVFEQAANDYGIIINDKVIIDRLNTMLDPIAGEEKSKKQILEELLASQKLTKDEFIKIIRTDLANNTLQQSISTNAQFTTSAIVKDLYQHKNETRDFEALIIDNSSIKLDKEPKISELEEFYEARREKYTIPEKRDISVLYFLPKDIGQSIEVTDEEIKYIYNKDKEYYKLPEIRTIQQSVFKTETTANKFVEALKNKKSFQENSKEISGSDDAFISKNDYSKEDLPEDYAEQIFNASKNDVVGPIKTIMGWHVIRLNKITKSRDQKYKEVKADIKKELLRDKIGENIINTAEDLDDAISSGSTFAEMVEDKSLPLHLIEIKSIDQQGNIGKETNPLDIFPADKKYMIERAYEYLEGEISDTIELASGGFAVIKVNTIYPKNYEKFENVKDDIEKNWVNQNKKITNLINSQKYLASINSGKTTLEKIAKDKGIKLTSYYKVSRSGGNIKNNEIPATALVQIFNAEIGKTVTANLGNRIVIATVKASKLPDLSKVKDIEFEILHPVIHQAMKEELYLQYYQHLSMEMGTKINHRLLEAMYSRQEE